MGYSVSQVRRFGGLQLSLDPADVGVEAALFGQNFEVARDRSFVRTRPGLTRLGAVNAISGNAAYRLIGDGNGSLENLWAISESIGPDTVYLDSLSSAGSLTAIGNWLTTARGFHDVVTFGGTSGPATYIATEGALLRKAIVASGLSMVAGSPKYLAVTPTTNRLVQGFFTSVGATPSGANGNKSCLFFSDPLLPEMFTETNFVHLRNGDGEELRGISTWREQTFALKETMMYVFGQESTDARGEPVFDYRSVTLAGRIGKVTSTTRGPVVGSGDMGVYYLARDGVYRTTGGPPVKVSGALDEHFRSGLIVPHSLSVVGHCVFIHEVGKLWKFDERHGQWSQCRYSNYSDTFYCPLLGWQMVGGVDSEVHVAGRTTLYSQAAATTDDGTVISAFYQSGYDEMGAPGLKVVRQAQVTGNGSVSFALQSDYGSAAPPETKLLATAPAIGDQIYRRTKRGRRFGFSVVGNVWQVNGVDLHLQSARPPVGVKA